MKKMTYMFNPKESLPQRAAHCLVWFARQAPGTFLPYNQLTKLIMGYSRMPNLKSQEVEQMRKRMKTVRTVLTLKYNCEVVSMPGVGVRATFSDTDRYQKVVPVKLTRVRRATESLSSTVLAIERKILPAVLRTHYDGSLKVLVDRVMAPGFTKLLELPPGAAAVTSKPEPKEPAKVA